MSLLVALAGAASPIGRAVSGALAACPDVEVIEVPRADPTELSGAVQDGAAAIVHAALARSSAGAGAGGNVAATGAVLAAAGAHGKGVRALVALSSHLVYGSGWRDPLFFAEDLRASRRSRSAIPGTEPQPGALALSLRAAEQDVRRFAESHPGVRTVTLRLGEVVGEEGLGDVASVLSRGLAPHISGFDPLVQVVDREDAAAATVLAVRGELAGVFNVAAPGRLPWSEAVALCGAKRLALPPVFTDAAARAASALLGVALTPELLDLLRYGRALDNRRLVRFGFGYRRTTAEAVAGLRPIRG